MAEAEKPCEEAATEEYESDLDDGFLPAARRRGAASDDDDEEEGGGGSRRGSPPPSTVSGSESDDPGGQGAAELYDDDEDEVYGTEEEEEDVEYEDAREEAEVGVGGGETEAVTSDLSTAADEGKRGDDEAAAEGDAEDEATMKREEVKRASDSEPYAVPTAGGFYQHDNRFQVQEDGNYSYQRQHFGGQKIWYPKEEAVWVHDLFDERNSHDNKHDNVSIMQSVDNGYFHGSKSYYDPKVVENVKQTQFHSYHGNAKGYNDERNMYRERGSRTDQSCRRTSRISSTQNNIKSYSKSQDAEVSYIASVKKHSSQTSLQNEQNLTCNQIFGSNTSSAPLPFHSATRSREKAHCVTFNKLFSLAVHKAHLQHDKTFPCKQTFGSNLSSAPPPFYSSRSSHQRHCTQSHNAVDQQGPILPTPTASAKIFVQKVTSTKKIHHPQTMQVSSSGDDEATAPPPESNCSVVVSPVTGHADMNEAAERTCFLDGGSLVLGATGSRGSILDDTGSSSTPAKLPVMLFSGVHPRGPGFPSDAMVLPEFVDQRRGGNSEMRLMPCESRLPILTGATGVQEGTISPPCFGSNYLQPAELASSLSPTSDYGVKKDPISLSSQDPISLTYQKVPEVVGHEFHLQNRNRRYSQMSFAL